MQRKNIHPIMLQKNRVRRTYSGGLLLDKWQNIQNAADQYRPEEWIASTIVARNSPMIPDEGLSRLSDNENMLLKEFIKKDPVGILGNKHVETWGVDTACLTKIIDSCQRLTIQVHPSKAFAQRIMKAKYGKTEAWYILGTRMIDGESPYVLLGFKPGMTREKWQTLFNEQDVPAMIDSLHRFEVKSGDVFLIEGGTPHAIGPGCFLVEIQEPTDYTMRPERTGSDGSPIPDLLCHQGFGYDTMLDCFNYQTYTREETARKWKLTPIPDSTTRGGCLQTLVSYDSSSCFSMKVLKVSDRFVLKCSESFMTGVVISGAGSIIWPGGQKPIRQADTFLIPADTELAFKKSSKEILEIIVCYPPAFF